MKKTVALLIVVALLGAFFLLGFDEYLSAQFFNSQRAALEQAVAEQTLLSALLYFLAYVLVAALSLPGAALLTLVGGALFGFWSGLLLVSFASSVGALLAFLLARILFKDVVQKKFSQQFKALNEGIENEGNFYLFTLRLIPIFPFFVVNLLMGLTPIKAWPFYWVSQLGMLAGTAVYVNAGTELAKIETLSGILSPGLILAMTILGVFPLLAKKMLNLLKAKKIYKAWQKPTGFDFNLVVIGAGAGGLVSAYIAAATKAKVCLIEKHQMGGDCLNTGCVPSKTLIRSAKLFHQIATSERWAIKAQAQPIELSSVMARVKRVIKRIEPHDAIERYEHLGVNVIQGEANIISPYVIAVNGRHIKTKNIIIATGAGPSVPPIPGLKQVDYLTSDTVWDLQHLPKRLLVLGGGPIGCELTQAFARLGSDVTQVEMLPRLMIKEDQEVSDFVEQQFKHENIHVYTNTKALSVQLTDGEKSLICEKDGQTIALVFDDILVAVGRKAHTEGFGLEQLNIGLNANGTINVNDYQQTNFPNIFAVGDVAGPYQFTHTAAHQAWYAAVNALFGVIKRFKTDYSVVPWATFIDPEVARVGLNEQEAKEQNIAYELTRYGIDDLDRAIADGHDKGFVKVLTVPGKDKILGVTIVGANAGELIAEFVLAMKHGLGLKKILATIHIYPTMMEASKFVAGQWQRNHAPQRVLKCLAIWHKWRLGGE